MSTDQIKTLSILAPAKINLYLHITNRLSNGYHTLDSLICFTDIGDTITITECNGFEFEINGPFASRFSDEDRDTNITSKNLVVRAMWAMAKLEKKSPHFKITLTKNLPLASGIGGGSSDAAATIWGLQQWWNTPRDAHYLPSLLHSLGADVPVCMTAQCARITGIGDIITPKIMAEDIPVVLVNPLKVCPTPDIFALHNGAYKQELIWPQTFENDWTFLEFLKAQSNDLTPLALRIVPEIGNITNALNAQKGCTLARMSGSGATCFGLFDTQENAQRAKQSIHDENPDWWVQSGLLNTLSRY
jgi:4-diphosphocytidyl-2-C-methyl-D-erythritol kinase